MRVAVVVCGCPSSRCDCCGSQANYVQPGAQPSSAFAQAEHSTVAALMAVRLLRAATGEFPHYPHGIVAPRTPDVPIMARSAAAQQRVSWSTADGAAMQHLWQLPDVAFLRFGLAPTLQLHTVAGDKGAPPHELHRATPNRGGEVTHTSSCFSHFVAGADGVTAMNHAAPTRGAWRVLGDVLLTGRGEDMRNVYGNGVNGPRGVVVCEVDTAFRLGSDELRPLLAAPVGMKEVGTVAVRAAAAARGGAAASPTVKLLKPIAPPGYVALGVFAAPAPPLASIACVATSCTAREFHPVASVSYDLPAGGANGAPGGGTRGGPGGSEAAGGGRATLYQAQCPSLTFSADKVLHRLVRGHVATCTRGAVSSCRLLLLLLLWLAPGADARACAVQPPGPVCGHRQWARVVCGASPGCSACLWHGNPARGVLAARHAASGTVVPVCLRPRRGLCGWVAHAFVASLWTQRFVGVEEMVGRSNPALIDTLTVTGLTSHTTCGLLAAAAAHGSQFGADVGGGVTAFLSHVRDPQFAPMVAALLASPFNQHLQLRGVQYVRSLATQLRVLGHPARDRFVSSRDVERYSYLMLAMYFSVRQVCGVWCVWVGGWCGCCVAWAVALPIGSTGLTGGARLSDGSTLMPPWRRFVRCTKPSLVATPGARQ